jgi:hypothetical protein
MVSEDGMLRVTLSARPERIESCRRLSEAELARRPVHMRQALECEGQSAAYRFRIWRQDSLLEDDVLYGSGFRRDRPLHLLREYALSPGTHAVRIEVRRIESASPDSLPEATPAMAASPDRSVREAAELQRRRMESLPPVVALKENVLIRSRTVTLVTWDPVARELRVGSATGEKR